MQILSIWNATLKINMEHDEPTVIDGHSVCQCDSFCYFGSAIKKIKNIYLDISNKARIDWSKWKATTGELCDRRIPKRLKEKLYVVWFMVFGNKKKWTLIG